MDDKIPTDPFELGIWVMQLWGFVQGLQSTIVQLDMRIKNLERQLILSRTEQSE